MVRAMGDAINTEMKPVHGHKLEDIRDWSVVRVAVKCPVIVFDEVAVGTDEIRQSSKERADKAQDPEPGPTPDPGDEWPQEQQTTLRCM